MMRSDELAARGNYVLLIRVLNEETISVGRLGQRTFSAGYYAYIGSAMRGFYARFRHYFNPEAKVHWHIDYLLQKAAINGIMLLPSQDQRECVISSMLREELEIIPGFGSSDCRCTSHLYFTRGCKDFGGFAEKLKSTLETGLGQQVTLLCSSSALTLSHVAQAWG